MYPGDFHTKEDLFQKLEGVFSHLEQQKTALDASAIVAITNVKGDITYVNDKFCEISQYEREELLGNNHRIINSGFHDDSFFKNLWKTIATGKIWRGEIQNRAKNGTLYWVYTTIVPYLNESGKPYQYVSIRFDITHQKNLAQELKQRNQQLADFVQIISHNLRAPLSNLLLLNSMIQESERCEEQQLLADKLTLPLQHLNDVFNELVASLQVIQDSTIKKERLSFESCLHTVMETLSLKTLYPKTTILTQFEATHINYPKKYLLSILQNLVSNAIKYRAKERPLVIEITTYKKEGSLFLEITDNGLGMDLETYGKKLFGLQKTFHGNPDARGFGLFMTKSQIETMGGSISAHSELGQGSTFTIQFDKKQSP